MTSDMWGLLLALIAGDITTAEYDQQIAYLERWR